MADETLECDGSNRALLVTSHAVCTGCGHVVQVEVLSGVWTFIAHDWNGVPLSQSGRAQ